MFFSGKTKLYERSYNPPERSIDGLLAVNYCSLKGDVENSFCTCNVPAT